MHPPKQLAAPLQLQLFRLCSAILANFNQELPQKTTLGAAAELRLVKPSCNLYGLPG
jgi:hypothetical protein